MVKMYQEYEYLNNLQRILTDSKRVPNRTGVDTHRIRSVKMNFDLKEGFPLLTTKRVWFRGVLGELIWMLRGDTNIKFLVDNDIGIWNDDAYRYYLQIVKQEGNVVPYSKEEFLNIIKEYGHPDIHPYKEKYYHLGDLGPIYGKQWRQYGNVPEHYEDNCKTVWNPGREGKDQIMQVARQLQENPYSRRHVVNSWNVDEIDQMGLPPCHLISLFSVDDNKYLNCGVVLRSNDAFLGAPFNMAQYALLTYFMAHWTGYKPGELDYYAYDFHLYDNHLEAAKEQLKRAPSEFPRLSFKKEFTLQDLEKVLDVKKFMDEYISLEGYKPDSPIKAELVTG